MSTVDGGYRVRPKVVDAGYHTRRLLRLTGLDAEENQARRLLNDLDTYRAESDLADEQQAAHRWLTEVFEPVVRAVPAHLRGKHFRRFPLAWRLAHLFFALALMTLSLTGMAVSLLAMNTIFGRFFDVLEVEAADPAAFRERTGEPY